MPKPNPYRQMDGVAPDLTPPTREAWMDEALCAQTDPGLWFEHSVDSYVHHDDGSKESAAKAICSRCPVRTDCLDYALATDERYGIWGGMTSNERLKVKRERRAS